jgi:transcriptional regulator with XRE-family HTH domain
MISIPALIVNRKRFVRNRKRTDGASTIGGVNALQLKKLLADNLERLMDQRADTGNPITHAELAARAKVGLGTIGRMAREEAALRVDTLESVAGVFGLRAWQLLAGPLDPANPPKLLTPEVQGELIELRALRAQVETAIIYLTGQKSKGRLPITDL